MFRTSPRQALAEKLTMGGRTRRSARRAFTLRKRATTPDCRKTALGPVGWAAHEQLTMGARRRCKPGSWHATTRRLAPCRPRFAVSNAALVPNIHRP